ncbi:MAG: OmpA family protein [Chromatiaceae bacterium]|nr:OmpA family protein [Chromatiaceae bacterium]
MKKETKTLRPATLALACALSVPFAASAGDYMMEHFWSAQPKGTAWVSGSGECWQSLNGAGDLAPCVKPVPEEFVVRLNFEFDKYQIANVVNDAELRRLDDYISRVNQSEPQEQLSLTGHTDAKGSEAYNYQLGLNRANAVRNYMVTKGIPARDIVSVESRGELDMLPNHDIYSVQQRRVTIRSKVDG